MEISRQVRVLGFVLAGIFFICIYPISIVVTIYIKQMEKVYLMFHITIVVEILLMKVLL